MGNEGKMRPANYWDKNDGEIMDDPLFQFLTEVKNFDLEEYEPRLGWIGDRMRPYKIYSYNGEPVLYLHDEKLDRLFTFLCYIPMKLVKLDDVIESYLTWFPENRRHPD